jgi:YebC/PmpR family DNA-binding regulatory protein
MSGHSKWSSIKHKKAAVDAKRGKIFTKIVRELTVAAKIGGGDPDANPRLRLAVDKAKSVNMPQDNMKKAIQKGTGELPGVSYDEITYEGYGPAGVAVFMETLTDNKNRTVGELRNILSKHNGSLGESGSVAWIFEKSGYILVDKKTTGEDDLMGIALDAGASDMKNEPDEENYEIITEPADMEDVKSALAAASVEMTLAEITMLPKNYVKIDDPKKAAQMTRLMDALEDHDDVQHVYANFDIPDELLEGNG